MFTTKPESGNRFGARSPTPSTAAGFPSGWRASPRCSPRDCRFAVSLRAYGMYDTHAEQPDALAQGLKVTSESLLAFQRDLEARGLADRVLTLVWSSSGGAARRTARGEPTTAPPESRC